MKETVEFWCSEKGGGCGGYFRARLRTNISGNHTVVCPNCDHEHNRKIEGGIITSERRNGQCDDRILVPKSAFSMEPIIDKVPDQDNEKSKIIKPDEKIIKTGLWARFLGRR